MTCTACKYSTGTPLWTAMPTGEPPVMMDGQMVTPARMGWDELEDPTAEPFTELEPMLVSVNQTSGERRNTPVVRQMRRVFVCPKCGTMKATAL